MNIRQTVAKELKEAMFKKDINLINALRLIIAAVKDKDILVKGKGNLSGINDEEIASLLQTMIKQRKASIDMYIQGNRNDLVKKEENEIKVITQFLPLQLSEKEIEKIIIDTIEITDSKSIKDIGKIINILKEKYNGKMDFGYVSKKIKEQLL